LLKVAWKGEAEEAELGEVGGLLEPGLGLTDASMGKEGPKPATLWGLPVHLEHTEEGKPAEEREDGGPVLCSS